MAAVDEHNARVRHPARRLDGSGGIDEAIVLSMKKECGGFNQMDRAAQIVEQAAPSDRGLIIPQVGEPTRGLLRLTDKLLDELRRERCRIMNGHLLR